MVDGNGNVMVAFDADCVRAARHPLSQVGLENHTAGSVCRTGFFLDGRLAWETDPGWDELSVRSAAGGQARYANDYYFQVDSDVSRVPGNPWFICTRWLAQWHIAIATSVGDLDLAREIIDWVCAHELPGGLLSEQVDPHSGAPLSASPLTGSHAEFVVTVEEYLTKPELLMPS